MHIACANQSLFRLCFGAAACSVETPLSIFNLILSYLQSIPSISLMRIARRCLLRYANKCDLKIASILWADKIYSENVYLICHPAVGLCCFAYICRLMMHVRLAASVLLTSTSFCCRQDRIDVFGWTRLVVYWSVTNATNQARGKAGCVGGAHREHKRPNAQRKRNWLRKQWPTTHNKTNQCMKSNWKCIVQCM